MKKNLFLLLLALLPALAGNAQALRIWEGTPVHAPSVKMTPFLPALPDGERAAAVIVCPGGSYFWLDVEHEGRMVAQWLQGQGFAAFLLEYRTGGWFNFFFRTRHFIAGHHFPEMVEDIQRAIQLVREQADAFAVDPDKVGTMGFSAGGHLVTLSAELCDSDFLSPLGIECKVSLRPDFVAPIYPVVTLEDREFVHSRSRRGLLGVGREKDQAMRDSLSTELHVTSAMPPVFLLNCHDDPVVDYRNSELLDSALTAHRVPHCYIQYEVGGHGFGADPARLGEETGQWQGRFLEWIKTVFPDED